MSFFGSSVDLSQLSVDKDAAERVPNFIREEESPVKKKVGLPSKSDTLITDLTLID